MIDLKIDYETIKNDKHTSVCWRGVNKYFALFQNNNISLKIKKNTYEISVIHCGTIQQIEIISDTPVGFDALYHLLVNIRIFEYLRDGAFCKIKECIVDQEDYTEIIDELEVGYFKSINSMHRINIDFSNNDYKKYLSRWIHSKGCNGIITQMVLYASNETGLPSDISLAMVAESCSMLAKLLDKKDLLSIIPEPDTFTKITCSFCGTENIKRKKGRKTLTCCLKALIEQYGQNVFETEYRRRKSLIKHIVKTRNKVFHVDSSNNKGALNGGQCRFYAIKLDLLFRYIILLQLGIEKALLDIEIKNLVYKLEKIFSQLVYHSK